MTAPAGWRVLRTEGRWLGICDGLGLTLESDTEADLMEDLELALEALARDGETAA